METIEIRQEEERDHQAVCDVVEQAFRNEENSDKSEHILVDKLRKCDNAFVPELSLVASLNNDIIGHILLTKISINDEENGVSIPSLCMAPVSVSPSHQKKGIGRLLIDKAHEIARSLGYTSVIVLGHPQYYPKFGYIKLSDIGTGMIKLPFEVPDDACMGLELVEGALRDVSGTVQYSEPFGI